MKNIDKREIYVLFIFFILSFTLEGADRAIKFKELIIRTPSLEPCYWGGPGTYYDHVDEVVQNATNLKFEILSVLVRTVDDDFDRGAMLYFSTQTNTHIYNCGSGQWNDAKLQYLINKAHIAGLKVYAWFPVFNDADLWDAYPQYRAQPVQSNELPIGKFCSPANTNVRNHELNIINEFMNTKSFGFDGIRLDYLRYQDEKQDQSTYSSNEYRNLYGKDIKQVIANNWSNPGDYMEYLDWRALKLFTFASQVRNLIGTTNVLGGYLMPHSGVDTSGYYYEPWSGVDYSLFKNLKFEVIPMLYWNDFTVSGYSQWDWVDNSMINTRNFIEPNSVYIPCFSLSDPENEWQTAINYMKKNNLCDIVVFYWGGGGYLSSIFDKMRNIVNGANNNYSYGHIISPNNKTIISNTYTLEFHCHDVPDNNFTISTCVYKIDNNNFTNFPHPVSTNFSTYGIKYKKVLSPSTMSTGEHRLVLKTVNNNNSATTDFIMFYVRDSNSPQIEITYPTFNQELSGITSITANVKLAGSSRSISRVLYYIDNNVYSNTMAITGTSPNLIVRSNWVTTNFSDGNHTIQIKVIDSSNYTGVSEIRNVYLNNITEMTYYVKTGGNNGNAGTSWAQAWQTIDYAVDNTPMGSVIWVSNGWYSENVSITSGGSNGVYKQILAYGGMPSIDGGWADVSVTVDTVKYVRIKGFWILGGNNYGGYVYHSTNIEFLDCEFADNFNSGSPTSGGYDINLLNSKNVKVSNCNIYGIVWAPANSVIWGINIYNSISNRIINNNIHNLTADGIYEVSVVNNIFKGNTIESVQWFGITSSDSKNNIYISNYIGKNESPAIKINRGTNFIIKNNKITNNNWVSSNARGGIYVMGGSYNINILNNDFSDNYGADIGIINSKQLILSNNNISGYYSGNYSSIDISYSTNISVLNNKISGSPAACMDIANVRTNYILNNRLVEAGEYGLKIRKSSKHILIKENVFATNGWNGIYVESLSNVNIIKNEFIDNGSFIIEIISCTNFSFINNTSFSNYGGVSIERVGGNNKIERNSIKGCTGYEGIRIIDSKATNYIYNNSISNSLTVGIRVTNSENSIIDYNTIFYVGNTDEEGGIIIDGSKNLVIKNNVIISNIEYGIYLKKSTNNYIRDNSIEDLRNATGNTFGIRVRSGSFSNFISQNYIKGNNIAIQFDNSKNNYIEKNIIRNNGSGIRLINGDDAKIFNNNIFNNSGTGIYIDNASINPLPLIRNNNLSSNGTGINNNSGQSLTIDYNCYNDTLLNITLGTGNTNADPKYKNTDIQSNDFHLRYNSPSLEIGYPNIVSGTIGRYSITVSPEYSRPGVYTRHKILFTTLYSEPGLPPDAKIYITYPQAQGFGFVYVTNCSTTSFWGGGTPSFSILPLGNKIEIQRIGGNTSIPGMTEDLIISTIINPTNIYTNHRVLLEIYDTNNNLLYKEWSNDFMIGPSYPFKVTTTKPENYSTGYPFSFSNIFVYFNNDINTNTVSKNSIVLINITNKFIYAYSVVNVRSNKIEFDMPDLLPNEFYTAIIYTNVKDIYTQSMKQNYKWYFSTGPGNMIPHYYDDITLDGNLNDWIYTNVIKVYGEKNVVIAEDTGDSGNYATTNLLVSWNSNYIFFSIKKNNAGNSSDNWYDYIAIDVTRDNWGATNFSDNYTYISFTNKWQYPEFVIRFQHDGTGFSWQGYSSYKYEFNHWETGSIVNWQGSGINNFQILEFAISVYGLTNIFSSDKMPNRISMLHWVDDNTSGADIQDFCPEPGLKWVTFALDNDGNDIADGSWTSTFTFLYISKSISNITLNGISSIPIPGASISYVIKYSNAGNNIANSALIYDKIISYVTFNTTYNINSWNVEFSTNNFPNQNWTSFDYVPNITNKESIKWIRWKKLNVNVGETGKLFFKVSIK